MRKFKFMKVIGKEDADILEKMGYRLVYSDGELYVFENNMKMTFASDDIKNRIVFSDILTY